MVDAMKRFLVANTVLLRSNGAQEGEALADYVESEETLFLSSARFGIIDLLQ